MKDHFHLPMTVPTRFRATSHHPDLTFQEQIVKLESHDIKILLKLEIDFIDEIQQFTV